MAVPRLSNLPASLTNFVGRKQEIAGIHQRVDSHRLVTLVGPGGCGKTRLAIEAACGLLENFEGAVWLVEFASLADGGLIPQAVASALGLSEHTGISLNQTLINHLQQPRALLIFDNCEHLITACAELAETLLQSCAELRILATSREALKISGEAVFDVPPLSLPELQPWRSPTSGHKALPVYEQSEAVQLFTERAAAASLGFTLTPENASWVVEICRRLDGLPLAIELAAARTRSLSMRQIANRLDDRFGLLTGGSRTAPARHKTLTATLDWSYKLLTKTERTILQRMAVFAGGWSLQGAEALCTGEELETGIVLDTLSNLVDKSLVTARRMNGTIRYGLLESVRQYAREKLAENQEVEQIRGRHMDYYVQWGDQAYSQLDGPEQLTWLENFETERDNLRAALEFSLIREGETEKDLRLAAAYGRFCNSRSYFNEGRARLAAALAHPKSQKRTALRARALYIASVLAYRQSDFPTTRDMCEESLSIWRELGPQGRAGVADSLSLLGEVATEEGDYASAPTLFEQALLIWKDLKDTKGIGNELMQLGWAAMRTGDYQQTIPYLDEALALYREAQDTRNIAFCLSGLGEAAIRQGRFGQAHRFLQESLDLRRNIGDQWGVGASLGSLGWIAVRQRKFKRVGNFLGESLAVRMEIGDQGGMAWCLEKLAEATILLAQDASRSKRAELFRQAAHAFGAAAALRAPLGSVIDPADQPDYERNLAALTGVLGEKAFAAEWADGEGVSPQHAVYQALSLFGEPALGGREAKINLGGLSSRERQVASLLASGKSNREIAEAMTVRETTVETYVSRILNKLGFDSRTQVAIWAAEKGLGAPSSETEN